MHLADGLIKLPLRRVGKLPALPFVWIPPDDPHVEINYFPYNLYKGRLGKSGGAGLCFRKLFSFLAGVYLSDLAGIHPTVHFPTLAYFYREPRGT